MANPLTSPQCGHTLNLDNLHFTADELRSLNELVVTAVLEAPSLSTFHDFVTGIKNDRRIGIIPGTFGLVGKAAQSCDPVAQCLENTAIEKTWSAKYLEIVIDMCIDELENTLLKLATKCGVDIYDLTKTQIFEFILGILSKDIEKMVFRHAWFGDVNAANFPVGVITPGYDVDFFNVIEGFWHQLATIYAADANLLVALPGNTQVTYALQQSVATPALMYAAINNMVDNAPSELVMQPDRQILCTRSVFDRLMRHLKNIGSAFQDVKLATDGFSSAVWDGIPIYSIPLWDQWIRTYENNGTYWNNPHRAVYMSKSNFLIGTPCTGLFDRINSFYDPRSRYNRIEAVDAFDAKIIDDRLVMVGI